MRAISLLAILGVVLAGINAQTVEAPSAAELAEITERGRALAEYDQAAWHATDAVQMAISGAPWLQAGWPAVRLLFLLSCAKLFTASLTIGSEGSAGDLRDNDAVRKEWLEV